MAVSESERIWVSIDRLTTSVGKLREKQAATEAQLKNICAFLHNHQKHKDRSNIIIIAIIGVVLTGINIFI